MSSSSPAKRRWFRYWISGRLSKFAHLLAVEWTEPSDGRAKSACGVDPYETAPHPLTVGFVPAEEFRPRCTPCLEAWTE